MVRTHWYSTAFKLVNVFSLNVVSFNLKIQTLSNTKIVRGFNQIKVKDL
ncbi:hypothetical protein VCHENC03_4637 [Vibrio sp. HENC-03]|nr:hypothetical protein VCHENC03_4637 [Vibrio sp. HENC-03]